MVLVIDNYDSFTYNLVQYLGELGAKVVVRRNDEASIDQLRRLGHGRVVISPGPGRPEQAGISLDVIKEFGPRMPVLGVCLGHQAIGMAFGGDVVRAPLPIHGKTSTVEHNRKGVFAGLATSFQAGRYHSLVVDEKTLPGDLEVTARTKEDGLVMGLQHRTLPIHGVQFHPESVLTNEGRRILRNFLEM
ncbi:MAG TPA: aminodeoxychorismate/anthranilate synthase component II [Vicinamibacterales bacterium]|nr:aminodeoxychorismate/anthranilate synthase component II [Vicinamibacterales bacterium]